MSLIVTAISSSFTGLIIVLGVIFMGFIVCYLYIFFFFVFFYCICYWISNYVCVKNHFRINISGCSSNSLNQAFWNLLKKTFLSASRMPIKPTSGISRPSLNRLIPTRTSNFPSLSCLIISLLSSVFTSLCKYLEFYSLVVPRNQLIFCKFFCNCCKQVHDFPAWLFFLFQLTGLGLDFCRP